MFSVKKIIALLVLFFVFPTPTYAVCPACTIAVGAGVGLSRYLGIDDTVTGLWVGALIISSSFWMATSWKQNKWLIAGAMFLIVIVPLFYIDVIGHPLNKLWGVDKLFLGSIIGSLVFLANIKIDKILRSYNNGKVFVAYQKVILPVISLLTASIVFYFITK